MDADVRRLAGRRVPPDGCDATGLGAGFDMQATVARLMTRTASGAAIQALPSDGAFCLLAFITASLGPPVSMQEGRQMRGVDLSGVRQVGRGCFRVRPDTLWMAGHTRVLTAA